MCAHAQIVNLYTINLKKIINQYIKCAMHLDLCTAHGLIIQRMDFGMLQKMYLTRTLEANLYTIRTTYIQVTQRMMNLTHVLIKYIFFLNTNSNSF